MATVLVAWTTHKFTTPAPTDLMQYQVSIVGSANQMVPFGTLQAMFADVAPGDYVAQVALANADGSHLADAKTANFTVPAPDVTLDGPDVVTVTLS